MIATCLEAEVPENPLSLERALGGDPDAFADVYREYTPRLLRHAMSLCGNATAAEELAQDTLVEAWRSLHRYNGRCEFFTWLCAILLNRYRNLQRTYGRCWSLPALWRFAGPEDEDHAAPSENLSAAGLAPDEEAQQLDECALVRKCIRALPARHQQVIYLRFYVDDSLEAIAAALGCSVGTVKSRLFHALEKLRRMKSLNQMML